MSSHFVGCGRKGADDDMALASVVKCPSNSLPPIMVIFHDMNVLLMFFNSMAWWVLAN